MADWIDVRDREPDRREPVVYGRPKGDGRWAVGIAYWTVSRRWCPELESTAAPRGFTHWKPLGEPPRTNVRPGPVEKQTARDAHSWHLRDPL